MSSPEPGTRPEYVRAVLCGLAWLVLAWAALLYGLGSFGLTGSDEPRYAAIGAEMLARHDFITPRLWGAVWLEKPPLYYWLSALGQRVAGAGDFGARLPVALLAALLSLLLGLFLRRAHSRAAGWLGAYFSATAVFWIGFGRAASTDMPLTATLAMSQMALFLWWRSQRRRWLLAASASLGLAALAKGPVAVLLAGVTLLLFFAWQRDWRLLRRWGDLILGAIVFLAVAAPWYVAVSLRNPQFPREFFLQQNLQRFATNRYQHPQPFWFYVPMAILAAAPWTLWLLAPAWRELRAGVSGRAARWRAQPLKLYLALWAAVPLVFFSLSQSKLPGYILPALPALIGLAAVAAAERWHLRRARVVSAAGVVLMAAAVLAATATPLRGGLDRRLSSRPLARQLAGDCGVATPAQFAGPLPPLTCHGAPVYQWQLNRAMVYGVGFYLHAELPDWAGEAGAGTRIVTDPHALARLRALMPGSITVLASTPLWVEVEVGGR